LLLHRRKNSPHTPPLTVDVDAESGAVLEIPISDISRVLEVSFHALFQDIKAFHIWKEEERNKTAELEGAQLHVANKMNPERSAADWVRLGLVANRLKFRADAEKLFAYAASHPIALSSLLSIYASRGDIRNTVTTASKIQKYYQDKYHITHTHPEVVSAILKVMGFYGLQKVRNTQAALPDVHSVIPNILFDSVRWRSKGFDL